MANIYETTYQSTFSRPQTTFAVNRKPVAYNSLKSSTGFAANNRLSPFDLTPLQTSKPTPKQSTFQENKPVPRAAMERSGYWDSPNLGINSRKKMDLNTSYDSDFPKYPTNQDIYWKLNRNLIGSREITPYSRQPITISQRPLTTMETTMQASYRAPSRRPVHIPSNVAVERSGFTDAAIPTHTKTRPVSDITANDIHFTEVDRLRRKDPIEYQNLSNHSPYMTVSQIAYQNPHSLRY